MSRAPGSMGAEKRDNIPMQWAGSGKPTYNFVNNSMPLTSKNASKYRTKGRAQPQSNQNVNRITYTQATNDGHSSTQQNDHLLTTSSQLFVSAHQFNHEAARPKSQAAGVYQRPRTRMIQRQQDRGQSGLSNSIADYKAEPRQKPAGRAEPWGNAPPVQL